MRKVSELFKVTGDSVISFERYLVSYSNGDRKYVFRIFVNGSHVKTFKAKDWDKINALGNSYASVLFNIHYPELVA